MSDQDETYEEIGERFSWRDIPSPSQVPSVLYHYTDASGLIGILSSGVVRATDFRYLNDKTEILHTESLMREILSEKLNESYSPTLNSLYSSLLGRSTLLQDDEEVYIFSMTEEQDSLSQWRAYSGRGMGFAIGFDAKLLAKEAKIEDAEFALRQVVYDRPRQRSALLKAIDALEQRYRRDVKGRRKRTDLVESIASVIGDLTVYRGSGNKHGAFRDEKEWRLVGFPSQSTEVKIRNKGPELVPYLEFSLGESRMLPILRVGIGPGFVNGNQRQAAKMLCNQFGYDPEIYLADAPYRAG